MINSIDFLRDEIRCGFYIPTAIKQAWAEALSVLGVIDDICKKHDIVYFADWGTLLGAVRHGGFIPWDDDLDICMLRDDYEKFRTVADVELPEGYVIHDYERKDDHWLFLARVVNHEQMCFDDEYLKEHNNFPWLVGIDIFLKDYLYTDEAKEIDRDKDIMHIVTLVDMINEGGYDGDVIRANIGELNRKYNTDIIFGASVPIGSVTELGFPANSIGGEVEGGDRAACIALYRLAERLMSAVKRDETDLVGQIFPWIIKNGLKAAETKSVYEDIIRIPFENTTIPVPMAYNNLLSSRYGNYFKIYKVWGGHDYPFFEPQKREMEEISGERLDRFVCDEGVLDAMRHRPEVDESASLKTTCRGCIDELYRLHERASEDITCFNDMQQLAVDLGTLIETVKGEDSECAVNVVAALQEFCDALWQEYQNEKHNNLHLSGAALDKVRDSIENNIIARREVLFLPIGYSEFQHIYHIYKEELGKPDTDVCVVPLPLLKKDYYGNVDMTEDEIEEALHLEEYKKCYNDLTITPWYEYDITIHCPDKVYTQNTYDEANPCLTVPAGYYTKAIREYAFGVTYIPIGDTAEFTSEDIIDQYNLKHYATTPAVVYADEVIVQSDNIKQQYVDALTGFAGEDTKEYWEDKISVRDGNEGIDGSKIGRSEGMQDSFNEVQGKSSGKKKLLYCVGINELYEKKDVLLDSLKDRVDVLKDSSVDVTFILYPDDKAQWEHIDEAFADEIMNILEGSFDMLEGGLNRPSDTAGEYDAYYGSPSPYVVEFTTRGKPVMLCDYSINV